MAITEVSNIQFSSPKIPTFTSPRSEVNLKAVRRRRPRIHGFALPAVLSLLLHSTPVLGGPSVFAASHCTRHWPRVVAIWMMMGGMLYRWPQKPAAETDLPPPLQARMVAAWKKRSVAPVCHGSRLIQYIQFGRDTTFAIDFDGIERVCYQVLGRNQIGKAFSERPQRFPPALM